MDTTDLTDEVRTLAKDYPQQPLRAMLPRLARTQQDIYDHFEGGTLHTTSATELHALASAVTGMLAKAAQDMGDTNRAIECARSSEKSAELAGQPLLWAWGATLLSLVAYWAGRPQEAATHAQRAAHLAGDTTSTVTVWAAASEARALAKLGAAEEVAEALTDAETAADRVTANALDEIGGIFTFTPQRLQYYTAEAFATVGRVDDALRYGNEAVRAYSDPEAAHWAFGDAAGSAAALATAHIRNGEIEGAQDSLASLLALDPELHITGVVKCVEPVYQALTATDTGRFGRELGGQIEAFMRTRVAIGP